MHSNTVSGHEIGMVQKDHKQRTDLRIFAITKPITLSALDKNYFPDQVCWATCRPCCLHTVSGLIKTLCGASCSLARGGGGSWGPASWTRRKLSSSSTWSPGAWWWIKLSTVFRGNFHNIHVAFFMLKKPIRAHTTNKHPNFMWKNGVSKQVYI